MASIFAYFICWTSSLAFCHFLRILRHNKINVCPEYLKESKISSVLVIEWHDTENWPSMDLR